MITQALGRLDSWLHRAFVTSHLPVPARWVCDLYEYRMLRRAPGGDEPVLRRGPAA